MSKKSKKSFMIIDGHAMAYRAHYAMFNQNMTNKDGMPTETIFGFFRMLGKIIEDRNPDHFCLVFDPPTKNFRHELYSAYKETRSATPPELKLQIDELQEMLKELKLPMVIAEGVEADDVIASMVHQWRDQPIEITMVSGDKDLYSLLFDNVLMLRPKKGVSEFAEITAESVQEELGITREQVPEFMALTGDSSDNVPGVKGIGPKGATKLINTYGNLDTIYEKIEEIKPLGTQEKLAENQENAFLSRELVTLKHDIELKVTLDDLTWDRAGKHSNDIQVFKAKDFPSLYNDWARLAGGSPTGEHAPQEGEEPETHEKITINENLIVVQNHSEWQAVEKLFKGVSEMAVDTETTSLRPLQADLVGVSLSFRNIKDKKIYSVYIPVVFDREHEYHFDYMAAPPGEEALSWVKPLLEDAKIKKIGQNIKYDYLVLLRHGVKLAPVYIDTMVLSYMGNPNVRRHNLDELSLRHLNHETIKYKDLVGTGKKAIPLVQVPLDELARYAAEDAEVTFRLSEILLKEIQADELWKLYEEIDRPLIELLAKMEANGVVLDDKYLAGLDKIFSKKLDKLEKEIHKDADEEFNINSTKELQRILFDKLAIDSRKKTAKGALSTDANVLEGLRNEHVIIDKLLDYRKVAKLLNGYIHSLGEYINPYTKRIHTSFSQTIAATGRLASSDPNLQNIPIKGEEGRAIRRAFIAPEGCELLALDYSQIELRILAHYSGDENLMRAYQNDEDIHDQAAYLLFHNRFDPETSSWLEEGRPDTSMSFDPEILDKMKATPEFSDLRGKAKILNFSIVYGVTEYGLARQLSIGNKEAKALIDGYFFSYPGIAQFMNDITEKTRESGYTENFFGRKRALGDLDSKNRFAREAANRLAINTPIQSSAADLIKLAMLKIQDQLEKRQMKTKMILQIHDELLFETPLDEKEEAYEMIKNIMENVVEFNVPLKVDGGFGKNWDEAK